MSSSIKSGPYTGAAAKSIKSGLSTGAAAKPGLYAGAAVVGLMLALGNERVWGTSSNGSFAKQTRYSLTTRLRFQVWDMPSGARVNETIRLILLILLTAALGAIAGRARPAFAAFVGGWTAFLAAAVLSSGIFGLLVDDSFADLRGVDTVDSITSVSALGAPLGLWLGWVVGIAVVLGARRSEAATGADPAPPPAGP